MGKRSASLETSNGDREQERGDPPQDSAFYGLKVIKFVAALGGIWATLGTGYVNEETDETLPHGNMGTGYKSWDGDSNATRSEIARAGGQLARLETRQEAILAEGAIRNINASRRCAVYRPL